MPLGRVHPVLLVALLVSVLLHLTLTTILWVSDPAEGDASDAEGSAAPVASAQTSGADDDRSVATGASPVSDTDVAARLDAQLAEAEQMTDAEKVARLRQQTAKLERISSPESVEQMGQVIRRVVGANQSDFKPAANLPPGRFEIDRSHIYAIERRTVDGQEKAYYVMVDPAGRTLLVDIPDGTDANVVAMIEQMQRSPLLRDVYTKIVLPTLDALDESDEPAPPSPIQAK